MDKKLYQGIKKTKKASQGLGQTSSLKRNNLLRDMAKELISHKKEIIRANAKDLKKMKESDPKYDRLLLNAKRIKEMADQLIEIGSLKDVLGRVYDKKKRPSGIEVAKTRVPMGVVGVIYESRPNVTSDVAGLCFKTGNTIVLRGGHEAHFSNLKIVALIKNALKKNDLPAGSLYLVSPAKRSLVKEMLKMNKLIDVVLARGGAGLIHFVKNNTTIPFIETGAGVCHTYVEKTADMKKAAKIVFNAKTQRPSVCNALDTLVIDEEALSDLLPKAATLLKKKSVLIKADPKSYSVLKKKYPAELLQRAAKDDFGREFLSLAMSIKTVKGFDEAVKHIQENTSGHSEAILTGNKKFGNQFLKLIDASSVFVNTSTRFADGNQYGLGAELGISTQKLHARGPMALEELTSYKWIIRSNWLSRA